MDFVEKDGFSLDSDGLYFQVDQDEFVHISFGPIPLLTWMAGEKRIEKYMVFWKGLGVIGRSFFYKKEKENVYKADLIDGEIEITPIAKIDDDVNHICKWLCLHYFIEREEHPRSAFAFSLNEDYRSAKGMQFNIDLEEIREFADICVYGQMLFGFNNNNEDNTCSVRRYQAESAGYVARNDLPCIRSLLLTFKSWFIYLTEDEDLVSVNMNDLSWKRINTNLEKDSYVVGIDHDGYVNVQSDCNEEPVHLYTAKLPDNFIPEASSAALPSSIEACKSPPSSSDVFDFEDFQSCEICAERYESEVHVPHTLHCGHTFCRNCIETIKNANTYPCPNCRRENIVDEGTFFPISIITLQLAEQANSIMKPVIENVTKCFHCREKVLPNQVRMCTQDDCNEYNQPICGNCACEIHENHPTVRFNEMLRYKTAKYVRTKKEEIEARKAEILSKYQVLMDLQRELVEKVPAITIQEQISHAAETVFTLEEAMELRATVDEFGDTFLQSAGIIIEAIDTVITTVREQLSTF